MLQCPNCNSKIPFWKPWFMTNFNGIKCTSCEKRLIANKKINSFIGGIGGGTGALIFMNLYRSNWDIIAVIIMILWFVSLLLATSCLTKLEIKDK